VPSDAHIRLELTTFIYHQQRLSEDLQISTEIFRCKLTQPRRILLETLIRLISAVAKRGKGIVSSAERHVDSADGGGGGHPLIYSYWLTGVWGGGSAATTTCVQDRRS